MNNIDSGGENSDIKMRLYGAILIAGVCLSVACIAGNYISEFPFKANLKWVALFLITFIAYIFYRKSRYTAQIMFCVFIFLICFFLPFAFIDSGGSNNNAIGYAFLLLISVTYLFTGWKRISLVAALVIVFMALHLLEYLHPEIIAVYSGKTQFVDRMIQIPLLLLASFYIILQFARKYEDVNRRLDAMASFDELTGLRNRRAFNSAMEEVRNNADEPVQLAFLDLDNFKKINDKYGHFFGDEALKKLAELLKDTIGSGRHVICRWGGDEFAVIYYGEKDELASKIEDIKKQFKDYISGYERSTGVSTSVVSIGDYDSVAEVLSDADKRLYGEKRNHTIDVTSEKR